MKKKYISGKITGLAPSKAKELFRKAELELIATGNFVINPNNLSEYHKIEVDKEIVSITLAQPNLSKGQVEWLAYMKVDLKLLLTCDTIYMIKNWKQSKGAIIEHNLAKELGYKIIYE